MRISLDYAHAYLFLVCACASYFGMRMRISVFYAHAHLILVCACASHFAMRMRISFCYAHVSTYLFQFNSLAIFSSNVACSFENPYSSERI